MVYLNLELFLQIYTLINMDDTEIFFFSDYVVINFSPKLFFPPWDEKGIFRLHIFPIFLELNSVS